MIHIFSSRKQALPCIFLVDGVAHGRATLSRQAQVRSKNIS